MECSRIFKKKTLFFNVKKIKIIFKYFLCFIIIIFVFRKFYNNNVISLLSPNDKILVQIFKEKNEILYKIYFENKEIISKSRLGLFFNKQNPFPGADQIKVINERYYDNTWELPLGEVRKVKNTFNETSIVFEDSENHETGKIKFRVYDDGVAFRYLLSHYGNINDSVIITDEVTQFNLIEDANSWWIPAYTENRYEHLFNKTKVSQIDTAHTPLTIKYSDGIYMSIHEASLDDYSSMQLFSQNQTLECDLAPWSNGDKVRTVLPFKTPWRTIIIAKEGKGLLNSKLTLNCNPPSIIDDISWIKPSKYIGIWWGMITGKWTWKESFRHGATNERALKYIDFASKHGFDEVLIEGWASGWESLFPEDSVIVSFTKSTSDFDFKAMQSYAKSKNVSIQAYHETMANTKNYLAQIDSAFSLLNELGIKNVKIGHVGSKLDNEEYHYSQYGVNYFRTILRKAVQYKIGVNFHEPVKDTGERRTFPNMLTREGSRGMEYNAWSGGNPPNHTLILPFNRLLSSPMDYTPGIFDLLLENLDFHNNVEYPISISIIDSGNGYENLRFKSSESMWANKNMVLDTVINNGKKINIWKIQENFQIGKWEWGITADQPELGKNNIWIIESLKNKNNRSLFIDNEGQLFGQSNIIIPFQNLKNHHTNLIRGYPDISPPRVSSTLAKQLALYVIIYSPLQMASDFIENYEGHSAFKFIKDVPVNWDTTVVLNGHIEEYITIARKDRYSKDWYLGSATNEFERSFEISLNFLDDGLYDAAIYADGENCDWETNPGDYLLFQKYFSNTDTYRINMAKGGGQAIRFKFINN